MAGTGGYGEEIVEGYRKLLLDQVEGKEPSEEDRMRSKELAEKRKAFLKQVSEELGVSQKKLEKDLGKILKKQLPKQVVKKPSPEEVHATTTQEGEDKHEDTDDLASTTTLARTLEDPKSNMGRGGYHTNTKELLDAHLEKTGGKWMTRFPPEPNGYLHIGHAKAMLVNFGTANVHDGCCYLRYDDTNPEAEEQEYVDAIEENVKWLGHGIYKVTFTSDYFDELYELAKELIRRGKAYVCFCPPSEVKAGRDLLIQYHNAKGKGENPEFPREAESPHRNRSVEENLRDFEGMKNGRFAEGEATLRMKMDLHSPNPNLWDQMAYRILYSPHHRTGDKWCIYPTYDYSHCLVDSLENITHSLCTLEFQSRQSEEGSYHWLLKALDMYHPMTWEYSRCSVSANVMSKRRLNRLVSEGYVDGWDDPRLLTLAGLKRRGYTPSAINAFCERIGVARSSNMVCINRLLLESCIRAELDETAPRRLAVLNPLKVTILDYDKLATRTASVPNHPAKPEMGTRDVPLTKVVYIPAEKFRKEMVTGYKGLVPGGKARLLNACFITCKNVIEDESTGKVSELQVEVGDSEDHHKSVSTIAWVPENAIRCEARLYEPLFHDCEVDGVEKNAEAAAKDKGVDFIDLLDRKSKQDVDILVEPSLVDALDAKAIGVDNLPRFQFITFGYFIPDISSTKEKPVFNRIVSLREAKSKQQVYGQ